MLIGVRSELGFGVKWLFPPNPVGFAAVQQ